VTFEMHLCATNCSIDALLLASNATGNGKRKCYLHGFSTAHEIPAIQLHTNVGSTAVLLAEYTVSNQWHCRSMSYRCQPI